MSDVTNKIEPEQQPEELAGEALEQVVGGTTPGTKVQWTHDDESPKEEITFEYGP